MVDATSYTLSMMTLVKGLKEKWIFKELRWLEKLKSAPTSSDQICFYDFQKDHDDTIDKYKTLKQEVERLIAQI